MRTAFILALTLFIFPAMLSAQGMMRMYRSMYSVSGSYSSGNSATNIRSVGSIDAEQSHEFVRLSTRNGYFISRNVALGFEFFWDQGKTETRPDPNPTSYRYKQFDRDLFIGPLLRVYQPLSVRWFTYPELSVGYRHYLGEMEENSSLLNTLPTTIAARGIGINAGAGIGYYISRNIVLDATLRYSYNWLRGSYQIPGQQDLNVDMQGGEIGILFGLQLLM